MKKVLLISFVVTLIANCTKEKGDIPPTCNQDFVYTGTDSAGCQLITEVNFTIQPYEEPWIYYVDLNRDGTNDVYLTTKQLVVENTNFSCSNLGTLTSYCVPQERDYLFMKNMRIDKSANWNLKKLTYVCSSPSDGHGDGYNYPTHYIYNFAALREDRNGTYVYYYIELELPKRGSKDRQPIVVKRIARSS